MKLNLTRPTLVITGAWNPAIFQPGWCAENLFDVPPGEQVRTTSVLAGPPPKEIVFFDQVGISVSNARLELFANSIDGGVQQGVENTLIRILEILPHTPIGALGANFLFTEAEPEDSLIDSFVTADSLRENYAVETSELKLSLDAAPATLNFSRALIGGVVSFNFNYHIENLNAQNVPETIGGLIAAKLTHGLELLQNTFDIPAEYEIENHNLPVVEE